MRTKKPKMWLDEPHKRQLIAIRKKIQEIVVTEGCDAGVILLSSDSPTAYDPEKKVQVYLHENFSPLGDALIELWKIANGE